MTRRVYVSNLDESDLIEELREAVGAGALIVYPTDTLYGIGGRYDLPDLIARIDRLKDRHGLPYSIAVSSPDEAATLTSSPPELFYRLAEELLPGPFTFLLPAAPSLPRQLLKGSSKVGIRVPDYEPLLHLIERIGHPFISTSVNRTGENPLNHPQQILESFPGLDLLIDGGELPESRGSTVIDLTATPPRCLRKGDGFDRLESLGLEILGG